MKYIALVALAQASVNAAEDLASENELGHLTGAFRKAQERRKIEAEEQAVDTITDMLRQQEVVKVACRAQIRALRLHLAAVAGKLNTIDRARAYAAETNNFIPWAVALGATSHDLGLTYDDFVKLSTVPASWTPRPKVTDRQNVIDATDDEPTQG